MPLPPQPRRTHAMTFITAATARFNRREAIRQMARDSAARAQELRAAAPMREPDAFETPLSPEEIERGVRDRTFAAPRKTRQLRPAPAGTYVTK